MVTMIIKDGDNALMMANYESVVGQTFVCAALINSRGGHSLAVPTMQIVPPRQGQDTILAFLHSS
jgi:hypothetical protein